MRLHSICRWTLLAAGLVLLSTPPAVAHEGHHHNAMGTIHATTAAQLDLETTEGKIEIFQLTATTTYKRGDAPAKREDLEVGERAVVMYETKQGKNVAIEVKLAAGEHAGHGKPSAAATSAEVPHANEPLATVARFASALESGDREGVLACLAPDVVIFEHGGAEMSREEYARQHLDGDLEYLHAIDVRVVDRRVLNAADRVVILTRSESTGDFRGKPVAARGTETLILERRNIGWVIVHVHWSSGKLG